MSPENPLIILPGAVGAVIKVLRSRGEDNMMATDRFNIVREVA